MLGDLTGRTAIVTGGGKGVGRAIAIALAEGGADVALADIDVNSAGDVASELEAGGRKAMALDMDVTSVESVRAAVRKAIDEWGRIDILVNNAGIVGAPGWIEAAEDRYEDWDAVVSVNLRGVVNCCKAIMPHMIERRYGKIITLASTAARPGGGGGGGVPEFSKPSERMLIPYAVTKAAVMRYTQSLASVLAAHNINVNGVAPGPMLTPMGLDITRRRQRGAPELMAKETEEVRRHDIAQATLFRRPLEPTDIGNMIAFLVSEDARNITGQVIPVDGGARMA